MSTAAASPIPPGMHTVTPHLCCRDCSGAIDFYVKAFGAESFGRLSSPDGRIMHAMIRIGDSHVFLFDEMPEHGALGPRALKGTPVFLHLYVVDVDAAHARAVAAGCTPVMPLADMFWGDRYGQVEDPYGHRWSLATHKQDLTPDEMAEAMRRAMPAGSADSTSTKRAP